MATSSGVITLPQNPRIEDDDELLSLRFHALANRTRRQLLRYAAEQELTLTGAKESPQFEISIQALGRHLHVLERSGLLIAAPLGRMRTYEVAPLAFELPADWIQRLTMPNAPLQA